jgi:threonine synthase
VPDSELVEAVKLCGRLEGIFLCPEGAACLPALRQLKNSGLISPEDKVVLFNTGTGLKYLEILD